MTEYDVSATGSAKWHKLVTFLQKRYCNTLHYETCFVRYAGEYFMSKSAQMCKLLTSDYSHSFCLFSCHGLKNFYCCKCSEGLSYFVGVLSVEVTSCKMPRKVLMLNTTTDCLLNSLAGPLQDLVKRENAKVTSQYSALELKIKSLEEQVAFQQMQVDAAQKDAQEWKKRYEVSINDYKKASDSAAAQHAILQKKVTTLEERSTTTAFKLEAAKKEASGWQSTYQNLLDNQRKEEERIASEMKNLQVQCSTEYCCILNFLETVSLQSIPAVRDRR